MAAKRTRNNDKRRSPLLLRDRTKNKASASSTFTRCSATGLVSPSCPTLMPCLRLPKSLLPPRRELKRLSSAVKNGLDWLARAKPGRSAVTAFRSVLRQARSLPLAGGWRREVEFGSRSHTVEGRRCMYEPPRSTRRFEPVYVDELVGGGSSYSGGGGQAEKGRGPGEVGRKEGRKPGRQKGPVMAWEVNERAEEFIERFREGMRVEREESIEDFKEMLARGAR